MSAQSLSVFDFDTQARRILSHVYEEIAVAMLTQHGIKCKIDRRKGSADILTDAGLRIEVKSSCGRNRKTKRDGMYWDNYQICNSKRSKFTEKVTHSDFFIFISEIGRCVFIVPTPEIDKLGKRTFWIPWTEKRLLGDFRRATWARKDSTASFLFQHKNAWNLLEQAERERL